MTQKIHYLPQTVTKNFRPLDEGMRTFQGIVTVEMVDKQGEITIRDELLKTFPIWMDRGSPMTDQHSNRVCGKGLNYSAVDVIDPKTNKRYFGIKIVGKIYDHTKLDDDVWAKIKSGEYAGLSFGGATRTDRIPVKQADGSIAYSLKDLEMYEIALCAEPAVSLALITDFNTLAKSLSPDEMCGMEYTQKDDGKIKVKCDNFRCWVQRDTEQIAKSVAETENLDEEKSERLNTSQPSSEINNMTQEEITKKDEKDEKDDKKDEEKSTVKADEKDDKKEDKDEKKAIDTLAGLVSDLVSTIKQDRDETKKAFAKIADQIKALESPSPARENANGSTINLPKDYVDDGAGDDRQSEDAGRNAEEEDDKVHMEEKTETVRPKTKDTSSTNTPRPNSMTDWLSENRESNSVLKAARELGAERFDILAKQIRTGKFGKVETEPFGYPRS